MALGNKDTKGHRNREELRTRHNQDTVPFPSKPYRTKPLKGRGMACDCETRLEAAEVFEGLPTFGSTTRYESHKLRLSKGY